MKGCEVKYGTGRVRVSMMGMDMGQPVCVGWSRVLLENSAAAVAAALIANAPGSNKSAVRYGFLALARNAGNGWYSRA